MTALALAGSAKSSRQTALPLPTVDQVMVEERAAAFTKRSLKAGAKLAGLKMAVSMMDLTTLEGKAHTRQGRLHALPQGAATARRRPVSRVAGAVCVYPNMVKYARRFLGDSSPVNVASVASGFPGGQMPLRTKRGSPPRRRRWRG